MTRLLLLAALLVGCPSTTTEEAHDAAACAHAGQDGQSMTATENADGDAPPLEFSEDPYSVQIVEGEARFVRIEFEDHGDWLLFSDPADVITAMLVDGDEVDLPDGAPAESCPEDVPEHYELHAEPGTVHLQLGPSAVDSVWLMVTDGDGHGHEHE